MFSANRLRKRQFLDKGAAYLIGTGGMMVVVAVLLIILYLLYETVPLFQNARLTHSQDATSATHAQPAESNLATTPALLYRDTDEYLETGFQVYQNGQVAYQDFTNAEAGVRVTLLDDGEDDGQRITATSPLDNRRYLWALTDGTLLGVEHTFALSYPNDVRKVTPETAIFLADDALRIDTPFTRIAGVSLGDALLVATAEGNALSRYWFAQEENFITEEISVQLENAMRNVFLSHAIDHLLINDTHTFALSAAGIFSILRHNETVATVFDLGHRATVATWLVGKNSLLIGDDTGRVHQWFAVPGEGFRAIRSFKVANAPIATIASERQRRVMAAGDTAGNLALFYTASNTKLWQQRHAFAPTHLTLAPRGNALVVSNATNTDILNIHNPHPEADAAQLWAPIFYENYPEPTYRWQSSAANESFEPKLSITPLVFGTIKAAFYAILLAIPLAIMGAIYTAFFMPAGMRRWVKPVIEIMEALPTIILGFLAGLWLSPFVEANLLGVFMLIVGIPLVVLAFGYGTQFVPERMKPYFTIERRVVATIPLILIASIAFFSLAAHMEAAYFGGSFRQFVSNDLGITYDQRNALVVGFAMGFAVIPTIFSITEDAIFGVPRHLVHGSLAMGASPWQVLRTVVLPTASPGIFSAVMIGFGRAVGETMIVLMATGNTPVMEWNIFEGMRTLAANIAVEMPESAVGSSHYRILFLCATVLFLFTFFFNTIAEVIRQRIRRKYATI